MDSLSNSEARRVALVAQGFGVPRPRGPITTAHLRRMIARLGVLQIDSVNVLARAHYLPAFARLGAYSDASLDRLAYGKRHLFEYWGHEASLLPMDLYPAMRWRMDIAHWPWFAKWHDMNGRYAQDILAEVAARGPLTVSDLAAAGERAGPWWGWSVGKMALEFLFATGRIAVAGRRNFARLYDIPERVIPAAVLALPTLDADEARRALLLRAVGALGIATANELADYYRINKAVARALVTSLVDAGALLPVRVEGWASAAYVLPGVRVPRAVDACALLSPFDPLVWERARTEQLFGMRYRIEIYVPQPKRVHGYYVLPFLLGEELVARVDLKADRASGALLVRAAHCEPGNNARAVAAALAAELQTMARWRGLTRVVVESIGDLAAVLARAVKALR